MHPLNPIFRWYAKPSNGALRWHLHRLRKLVGYDETSWQRVEQWRSWRARLATMPLAELDAAEISPAQTETWARHPWRSYTPLEFPEFDICKQTTERKFDVVVADQVFEHVPDPEQGAKNVRAMLKPGGTFFIATPFLLHLHGIPDDHTRWTPNGMRNLLLRAGFKSVEAHSWGNRACARAHLTVPYRWAMYGWGRSLRNEPEYPCTVWAFAQA